MAPRGQCSRPGGQVLGSLGWAPFPSPPLKGTPQADEANDMGGNGQKQEGRLQGHPNPIIRISVQEQRGEEGEKGRGGEKTEEN